MVDHPWISWEYFSKCCHRQCCSETHCILHLSGRELYTCVQVGCVLSWNISGIQTFSIIFGEGMETVWASVRKPVPETPEAQNTHPGHSGHSKHTSRTLRHSKHTSRTLRATRNSVLATCAPILANEHYLWGNIFKTFR